MDNYTLTLDYLCDQSPKHLDSATFPIDNDDLTASLVLQNSRLTVDITPKKPLAELQFLLATTIAAGAQDVFYSNGFQSWSLTREYSHKDKSTRIPAIIRPIIKSFGGECSGDYSVVKRPTKKGEFNSCSYTYWRAKNTQDIRLMGSLDEKVGYTYYTYSFNSKALYITKDFEGKTFDSPFCALDMAIIEGEYSQTFTKYFEMMHITPRKATPLVGYTSWYNNFRNINNKSILRDLTSLTESDISTINCFQIDDGYQPCVGDLVDIDTAKFPDGLTPIVQQIHDKGFIAGLWLCPFGATKASRVYKEHFDWIVKDNKGKPIKVGAAWGGFYCLDFYNEQVRDYIRTSIRIMTQDWGFDMLKMDFLYCVSFIPRNNKTRAEIMCEAVDFLRDCAGDAKILGCGVPLFPAFGKFEYCRIGADVSFAFAMPLDYAICDEVVSTRKTLLNSLYRRHLDGRAFYNDTDVAILRDMNTQLNSNQKIILTLINKLCGSVLFVSDDVGQYKGIAQRLFRLLTADVECHVISTEFITAKELSIDYVIDNKAGKLCYNIMTGDIILDTLGKD